MGFLFRKEPRRALADAIDYAAGMDDSPMFFSRTLAVTDRAITSFFTFLHLDLQLALIKRASVFGGLVNGICGIFGANIIVIVLAERPRIKETSMSRSTDKDIEKYVFEQMPAKVKKALADAKYDLFYGPSGGGGMGFVKASEIVERWWDEHMNDDLVVDDGGNVVRKYMFDRYVEQSSDEREKEALQEAIDEGIGDDEEGEWDRDEAKVKYAKQEAQNYADSSYETATVYDSNRVKRMIFGKGWP
jgi:hypothetical protein